MAREERDAAERLLARFVARAYAHDNLHLPRSQDDQSRDKTSAGRSPAAGADTAAPGAGEHRGPLGNGTGSRADRDQPIDDPRG